MNAQNFIAVLWPLDGATRKVLILLSLFFAYDFWTTARLVSNPSSALELKPLPVIDALQSAQGSQAIGDVWQSISSAASETADDSVSAEQKNILTSGSTQVKLLGVFASSAKQWAVFEFDTSGIKSVHTLDTGMSIKNLTLHSVNHRMVAVTFEEKSYEMVIFSKPELR